MILFKQIQEILLEVPEPHENSPVSEEGTELVSMLSVMTLNRQRENTMGKTIRQKWNTFCMAACRWEIHVGDALNGNGLQVYASHTQSISVSVCARVCAGPVLAVSVPYTSGGEGSIFLYIR